jgi:hypothetical protein
MPDTCSHLDQVNRQARPSADGCEDCLRDGHALLSSYEPGGDWWWCFEDEFSFTVPGLPSLAHP